TNQSGCICISKLLKHFGWTWVGILRVEDSNTENEVKVLTDSLSRDGICVEFTITISPYLDKLSCDKEINRINEIVQKSTTNIIIICGRMSKTILFLNVHVLMNKTLILSTSASVIGHNVNIIAATFHGSLMLEQYTVYPRDTHEITEFINNIHPSKDPKDKLLEEILFMACKCPSKDPDKKKFHEYLYKKHYAECEDKNITKCLSFLNSLVLSTLSPHVHLAVDIMSQAVDEMLTPLSDQSPEKDRKAHRYQYQ
ncbi:hypothetical protein XELAEV_180049644mg, partial [Xenopus laevis]